MRLWDLHTNREIAQLLGHTNLITHVAISPDGRLLASSSFDGTMRLWKIGTHQTKKIYTFSAGRGFPEGMAFSPDSTWLVVVGTFREIKVIELATGDLRITLTSPVDAPVDVVFDRTGHRLAISGNHGSVQLRRFQLTTFTHIGSVTDVALDPPGQTLASGSGGDNKNRLWDVKRGELLHEFTGRTKVVKSVAFRPDGKVFSSTGDDGTVRLRNPATGVQQAVLTTSDTALFRIMEFSPDSAIMAAAGSARALPAGAYPCLQPRWSAARRRQARRYSPAVGYLNLAACGVGSRLQLRSARHRFQSG